MIPLRGTYIDCLWEGSPEIRAADTAKLLDAGFDCFTSQIRSSVLDATSVDAKWLDACKAAGAKVIVVPNTLQPAQYQSLVARYPDTIIGYHLQDDANGVEPADVLAAYNAMKPFLAGTFAYITVGKGTPHANYAALWAGEQYHVQNYIGKAVNSGDGMKKYAYDDMILARAAVPAAGRLWGSAWLGKSTTPYFGRRDPVWTSLDYANPYLQEAVIWLQLMAGMDHLNAYTAYSIPNVGTLTFPGTESRLADRWDLLPGWKLINGRIKGLGPYLNGGVRITRYDAATKTCIGEWKLTTGESLLVSVDVTSEFYPRAAWEIKTPVPATVTNLRVTSQGPVVVEKLP